MYNGPRNLDNELRKDRVDYRYENSLHIGLQGASRYRVAQEEKTPSPIAAEYKVHPKVLRDSPALALKGLPSLFEKRDDLMAVQAAHAQQLEDLYAQIGRLTTQLGWIKKTVRATAPYVPAIVSYAGPW